MPPRGLDASDGMEGEGILQSLLEVGHILNPAKRWPARLYHYTTAEGLLGILQSGRVYASDLAHANDPSEAHYCKALVLDVLDAAIVSESNKDRIEVLTFVRGLLADIRVGGDTFAFCLSEVDDQLGQWRAYSSVGLGYCIGFNGRCMRSVGRENAPDPYFGLQKVVYDVRIQRKRIESVIAFVMNSAMAAAPARRTAFAMTVFLTAIQSALVTFKNPAFAEEREWRALSMGHLNQDFSRVAFRTVNSHLVPFEVLDLWGGGRPKSTPLPIASITAGPRVEHARALASVRILLRKYGYPDTVTIAESGVPLR